MKQQRLGCRAEARKTVDQALQAIARWKPKGKPNLLIDWRQRLGLRKMQREAQEELKYAANMTTVNELAPSSGDGRLIDED